MIDALQSIAIGALLMIPVTWFACKLADWQWRRDERRMKEREGHQ